jgi:starch phosphorylase
MSNNGERDPVCGMTVQTGDQFTETYRGQKFHFCSALCASKFIAHPGHYAGAIAIGLAASAVRRIAYFSMEVAIDPSLPTYSGGLGVLAGDTLKSCADLRMPVVGISLLYRKGYFDQKLDERGNQRELVTAWEPRRLLKRLPSVVRITIADRPVTVAAWQYEIRGVDGYSVPLILLDTDLEENAALDREVTSSLYAGDRRYRLCQEVVLGIGGIRMLRALGYADLQRFHMNEGHPSLLAMELLAEEILRNGEPDFDHVRESCIFTTHTPVAAGHDEFAYALAAPLLRGVVPLDILQMLGGQEQLNMTRLGLNMSRYVNGVAKRHGEVSREMFPGYSIDSITNGVHSATWTCDSFQALYDHHITGWRNDPAMLRHAISVPGQEVWDAHRQAKKLLLDEVLRRTGTPLNLDTLTLGFARRATQYKRANLVFSNLQQLREIARQAGAIQFVFAGKAHPSDEPGKDLIRRVFESARELGSEIRAVYLENYDLSLAKLLTAGADLWLNTPLRPQEASGTSGMKAAHNGVPSFSVLDGWWVEGCIENVTGWSIGPAPGERSATDNISAADASDLYHKLRSVIVPTFYRDRGKWIDTMRHAIALNASFFNSHRMVQQYATNAYL